jgi:hypothetical protein
VKEIARTTAISEVKKTLSIDDPNSDFRRDIDKVVARGLIDSYLLSLAKSKQDQLAVDLPISETDFRRLQNLVTDPQSNTKDFSDAIEVLTRSSPRTQNEGIDRLIIALASGSDSKYKWIVEQPEKRAAIFTLFLGDKLVPVAKTILSNGDSNKELLVATIKYAGHQTSDTSS